MRRKTKLVVSDNSNTIDNSYDDQSLNTNHDDDIVSPPRVHSSAKKLGQLDERRCSSR